MRCLQLMCALSLGLGAVCTQVPAQSITTFADLQDCVGPNTKNWQPANTCVIGVGAGPGGLIPVTSTLIVSRYDVEVEGDTTYPAMTLGLIRATPASTGDMVQVTNVAAFYNMVFDGNASGNVCEGYGNCSQFAAYGCPDGGYGTTSASGTAGPGWTSWPGYSYPNYVELDVAGSSSSVVESSLFKCAAKFGIAANTNTFFYANTYMYMGWGGMIGFSESGGTEVKSENSYYTYNGLSAETFEGIGEGVAFYDSINNSHYLCLAASGGGQVLVGPTSSTSYPSTNALVEGVNATGQGFCPNGYASTGLEMYGSGHMVEYNQFNDEYGNGIGIASGGGGLYIANNTVSGNQNYGISILGQIYGGGPEFACVSSPTFTIKNNTIENNSWWGLMVAQQQCATGPDQATVSESGDTYSGNMSSNGIQECFTNENPLEYPVPASQCANQ